MKTALPVLITLLLQAIFSALAAIFNFEALRIEPAIVVLTFTAVRLDPVAGALVASAIGFSTDLLALSPLGLHMLAFTVIYLVARLLSDVVGVTRPVTALPLIIVLSAANRLLLVLLLVLFADGGARVGLWQAQLPAILLDGIIAVPIWAFLEWLYKRWSPEPEGSWRVY